jgi:hypothetical protein
MRRLAAFLILAVLVAAPLSVGADEAYDRDATLAKLAATLTNFGATDAGVTNFRQSTKQPYNWIGTLDTGLKNSQMLEIVASVTKSATIGFRVYPHVRGGYINIVKAKKAADLRQRLLNLNDSNFMFWGADDTNDVFVGYTFTLESGYPEDAIRVVLRSIPLQDPFVGQLLPDL